MWVGMNVLFGSTDTFIAVLLKYYKFIFTYNVFFLSDFRALQWKNNNKFKFQYTNSKYYLIDIKPITINQET